MALIQILYPFTSPTISIRRTRRQKPPLIEVISNSDQDFEYDTGEVDGHEYEDLILQVGLDASALGDNNG